MGMGTAACSGYVFEATYERCMRYALYHSVQFQTYVTRNRQYLIDHMNYVEGLFTELIYDETYNEIRWDIILEFLHDCIESSKYDIDLLINSQCVNVHILYHTSENGDRYDELSFNTFYFIFDENDLYVRELRQLGMYLQQNDDLPEKLSWTVFG